MHGMTLDQYLTERGITNTAFAPLIGVDQSTVHRLRRGQVPSKELMLAIVAETGGLVRADDFFGLDPA
jgi:DNA-binding Xre family transcriptional regulator